MPIDVKIALLKLLCYVRTLEIVADQYNMEPNDIVCKQIALSFYRKYVVY